MQLDPGDTLVIFSDGISEALNSKGEEFGEDRLVSCLETNRDLPVPNLLKCVLDTVQQIQETRCSSKRRPHCFDLAKSDLDHYGGDF